MAEACSLKILRRIHYNKTSDGMFIPTLPVIIHRKGMKKSVKVQALVDTGLDAFLVVSKEVRDILYIVGNPETQISLGAGDIEIPCESFRVRGRIAHEWRTIDALAPIPEGFETLIGNRWLQDLNVCLRGPESTLALVIADTQSFPS